MAAFKWINMSLLLILMLQSTAQTETGATYLTVRVGNKVMVPCGNQRDTNDKATWIFSSSKDKTNTKKIVELGPSHKGLKMISDRLIVKSNFSLALHNVTVNDVAQYTCQLTTLGGHHNFVVYVSIVNVVEQKNSDTVRLMCSVLEYDHCVHEVRWFYEGGEGNPSDFNIVPHTCSASVTFPTSHLDQISDIYSLLRCEVTNTFSKVVQQFPFKPQLSEGESLSKTTNSSVFTSTLQTSSSWWYVSIGLFLAALLIAVLVIVRWKQNKVKKRQVEDDRMPHYEGVLKQDLNPDSPVATIVPETSQNQSDQEDAVSYTFINFKKTKKKTGIAAETVIYSTVGSSSSSGIPSDVNCLDSTVNKRHK